MWGFIKGPRELSDRGEKSVPFRKMWGGASRGHEGGRGSDTWDLRV